MNDFQSDAIFFGIVLAAAAFIQLRIVGAKVRANWLAVASAAAFISGVL